MKKLCMVIMSLMFCSTLFAQTLKGRITDADTGEPLAGVNITYTFHGIQGIVSDSQGAYSITLPANNLLVTFSYIGYDDVKVTFTAHQSQTIHKDIRLSASNTMLQDVVVSAGRFEQKLSDITVSMDLLKSGDIVKQAPTDLSAVLKTLPGVDVNDKQPSIRGGAGWTYGVGARSQILVDGMSILTPASGEINWNVIPMENVEQVEIIKGASSVLYGSSALNGVINVRTARPGLVPKTHIALYNGIYGNPDNGNYGYENNRFWKSSYAVKPLMRRTVFNGLSNPLYDGMDFSHSRRINNFDVTAGMNLFNDEGYKQQGFNKRFRVGGNLTYHQPNVGNKVINYGFNANLLADKYGDFFIWRSPQEAYRPSPFTNMGRKERAFYIDPFFNFTNPDKQTSHKLQGRIYYRRDRIFKPSEETDISDVTERMGTDMNAIENIANGNLSMFYPLITPAFQKDWTGVVNSGIGILNQIFPSASTSDYCDLIAYAINHGLPSNLSELVPWLSGTLNNNKSNSTASTKWDKNFTYYLDYQYNKRWNNGAQITLGGTFEHIRNDSEATGLHISDNAAAFMQYDQRLFDKLNVSAGVRTEYYRVDEHYRESDTKVFGKNIPIHPVFRLGLNYQPAQYSFVRASIGQGYRNPSITEKYVRKDIGGVGVYPNDELKAEKGYNAELGFKQGYKIGRLKGFIDLAGFYTEYRNMVEFQFGLFNNTTYKPINSLADAFSMFASSSTPGIGAQFHNVSKARIYGTEISTNGLYDFNRDAHLSFSLGYLFIEPKDVDYKTRNAKEAFYSDPLQMKEKSNNSKYLKYRQKHTFKAVADLQWKRFNLGTNLVWKSKTLAVDYLMVDERPKVSKELMDYVRDVLFGNINGETLASYWERINKPYATVDLRAGVRITKELKCQFLINNLLNSEYCTRPMAVSIPRTFVMQINYDF